MISRNVTIVNKLGLHARAASRLVNCAAGYAAEVRVCRDGRCINGKSIMGVLTLAAARGVELTIETDGADEQEAMDAIAGLIGDRFGEEE